MDLAQPTSALPPGAHAYEAVVEGLREGRYRFARVRTASGRLQHLIGISPEQYAAMSARAARDGVGLVLLGSRVCGPRTRQKTLHPVLAAALPLRSTKRTQSATYAGVDGVEIDKSMIKEFGLEDVRTSDVSVILVDPAGRPPEALQAVAVAVEEDFKALGCPFPLRVYGELWGERFRCEEDFVRFGMRRFLSCFLPEGHPFRQSDIRGAVRELYCTVNMPRPLFDRRDLATGLWNGVLASVSFWAAFKLHPSVFAVGFAFGFFGRRLARLKAWIAGGEQDTFASNALALLVDWVLGVTAMGGLINPLAGLGVPLRRILWTSALHTMSKGSMRLYLDKLYSRGDDRRQSEGVVVTTSVNFLQGLATSYIYAGSAPAAAFQVLMGTAGVLLAFSEPLRRLLRLRPSSASVMMAE